VTFPFSPDSAIVFPDLANWRLTLGEKHASAGESIAALSIVAGSEHSLLPSASLAAKIFHSENQSTFETS
jgi:hypothetical protein